MTATDSSTPTAETATANVSITVTSPPLSVTTTALPNGAVGMAYPASDARLDRRFGPDHLGGHHRETSRRPQPRRRLAGRSPGHRPRGD